ncbi:MAG: N-acetylmuramic acid 6-phosphate etherase [Tannerellaceae bacterium]|jgi:N-acetylmuramic acid 6-phosphate etherase|nr:N-acetylmuramic acid 6-phosphate etherase [Tannerellaceae bacterium]
MTTKNYLVLDIGGTWLKGILVKIEGKSNLKNVPDLVKQTPVVRVKSRLSNEASVEDFIDAIDEFLSHIPQKEKISGIGISTAGIVNYHGTKLLYAGGHLKALIDTSWIDYLKKKVNSVISIRNDADAASIGAASLGYLSGDGVIGIMPIGTGLGFTVWRNGRRWTPNFSLTLLGCTYTPEGCYDRIGSASILSGIDKNNDLCAIFTDKLHFDVRDKYIKDLAGIVLTTHALYHTDKVLIGGGLADAVYNCNYPLADRIKAELAKNPVLTSDKVEVELMKEGNTLSLIGACLFAIGEEVTQKLAIAPKYVEIDTETPFNKGLQLEKLSSNELVRLMWRNEQEAGEMLEKSLADIIESVDLIVERLEKGGRLIYIGSGTSGRLAAIDAVELSCTFGFPRDRVLTFISGGVADASIDIETGFEEDASSVPELLLANLGFLDVVVGISVSGSAFYVQSGLGFSKFIGAYTIMIQQADIEMLPFCDKVISLHSGPEIIAGSTRMKAGTATKKILNFLSTSVMIRLGKVHGCYMTELECINEKLISRAISILMELYELSHEEAFIQLKDGDFQLNKTIKKLSKKAFE